MNDMEQLYRLMRFTNEQIQSNLREIENAMTEDASARKSIIIKEIKGKRYYYSQWREDGKLRTQYLCPVRPGAAAEFERKMERQKELLKERKEQLQMQKYVSKWLNQMEKDRRKKKLIEDYSFEVFWKDEITARVSVQGSRVKVSRYTEHPLKQLFAEKLMTRHQLNRILELRCWEKGRADIRELLGNLGLEEYNPYEIVKKTHGVSYNDYIWFRFPGEKLTSKDVLVR